MEWKAFIASLVSSLAWPSVVLCLIYLLRNNIGDLAERIEELTLPGGAKAKFIRALEEAKEETQALPGAEAIYPQVDAQRTKLAELAPDAAILLAWKQNEEVLQKIREKLKMPPRTNMRQVISKLHELSLVPISVVQAYERLRYARNEAAHVRRSITAAEANDYAEQASVLEQTLKKVLERIDS